MCCKGKNVFNLVGHVSCSVAVTRLRDVPYFGPALPENGRFKKNEMFKELLLTKRECWLAKVWLFQFVQCFYRGELLASQCYGSCSCLNHLLFLSTCCSCEC